MVILAMRADDLEQTQNRTLAAPAMHEWNCLRLVSGEWRLVSLRTAVSCGNNMHNRSSMVNIQIITLRKTSIADFGWPLYLGGVEVEFDDDDLRQLYEDAAMTGGFSQSVVSRFRDRIGFIKSSRDERDLYAMRSLRFERLKGKRQNEFSMRLNDQWRLIVQIRGEAPHKRIAVLGIEDYH